jgi:hypothetical protein
MTKDNSVVAVFTNHGEADAALRRLATAGFAMDHLSVIGQGYHTEEQAIGFYNMGDRVKFWGSRGALWGGLWGLFFGGLFMTVPVVGHIVVLGYLSAAVMSAVETAIVVGGASAIGAALASIGIPQDSVIQYEAVIKADGFLVMAHGSAADMERANTILAAANPSRIDLHTAPPKTGTALHKRV